MVNQCTKFEVFRFTNYEDMNGSAKCRKWGGQGTLRFWFNRNATIRQSAYDFLFDFNRNYVSIFYRFQDIADYLPKVANFDLPHLRLAPPYGVTPVEFRADLWLEKTRGPGLSCGVICVIVCLAVLVELRLVTDTDRHRLMASTADAQHRAVKTQHFRIHGGV